MKVRLTDHSDQLAELIPLFREKRLSYTSYVRLPERTAVRSIPTARPVRDLLRCDVSFLFNYDVFPSSIMRFAAEWQLERRWMREGDIIVQQAFVPPTRFFSLKCIFAVRVLNITRSPTRIGFQYGTLEGHAETGVSEFALTPTGNAGNAVDVIVHTFSQSGTALSRVVAPMFTLPYQRYCAKRALEHMCEAFLRANPWVKGLVDGDLTN